MGFVTAAAGAAPPTLPDPKLSPTEVTRLQLDARAHNDRPSKDAGIALVWRFASPGNQAQTGPLPRFTQMIHHGYAEMIDPRSATLTRSVVQGDEALQGVELIDHLGLPHRYIFRLTRQSDPPYRDCWMTDGVLGSDDGKPAISI